MDSDAIPRNARRHHVRSHQVSAVGHTLAMKALVVAQRQQSFGETVTPHPYIEDARGTLGFSRPQTVLKTAFPASATVSNVRADESQELGSADVRCRLPPSDRTAVILAVRNLGTLYLKVQGSTPCASTTIGGRSSQLSRHGTDAHPYAAAICRFPHFRLSRTQSRSLDCKPVSCINELKVRIVERKRCIDL